MTGVSAVHVNIFGPHPVAVFGTDDAEGAHAAAADPGRDALLLRRDGAGCGARHVEPEDARGAFEQQWLVNGRKMWTTTAQTATHILLLARTSPKGKKPTDGLSLFYTPLDRAHVEVREIAKMGRHAVDTNMLFIDDLAGARRTILIGEEGKGFDYLLHAFNPERILVAAEAIGIGRDALAPRREVCARARRVRPADRAEPGDPASACARVGGA